MSGEVEFAVILEGYELLVSVGSDHCDRTLESIWQDKPKQMCPKVVAPRAWRYLDVADHWDDLIIQSWVTKNGYRGLFQESSLNGHCTVSQLFESDPSVQILGVVLFGETPDCAFDSNFEDAFEMELYDPVHNRSIRSLDRVVPLSQDDWGRNSLGGPSSPMPHAPSRRQTDMQGE